MNACIWTYGHVRLCIHVRLGEEGARVRESEGGREGFLLTLWAKMVRQALWQVETGPAAAEQA